MDKDKLENLIIQELKKSWTDSAEKIAARIISKIPDDVVIAEGIVKDSRPPVYDNGIEIGEKDVNELFDEYIGKSIRLKLEVVE
jgi:hypothetical protein